MFQLSTVNKVIQILIVGTFFVAAIVFLVMAAAAASPNGRYGLLDRSDLASASALITGLALLLPVAVLIGMTVDGLSSLTLQRFLDESVADRSTASKVLQVERACKRYNELRVLFCEALSRDGRFDHFVPPDGADCTKPRLERTLAVALLFQSCPKEAIDWGVQHYSFHLLASNFMVALLLLLPFATYYAVSFDMWLLGRTWIAATLATLPVLARVATLSALYSYEVAFRHALVAFALRGDKIQPK